jgi:hypothetical protein
LSERVYWNKFLKFLPGIALACLLVSGAACGLRGDDAGPSGSPPSAVQTDGSAGNPANNPGGNDEKKGEDELVIKSDNRGSGEEADEMLKEVDRELDALIRALDALDAVDTGELEEG